MDPSEGSSHLHNLPATTQSYVMIRGSQPSQFPIQDRRSMVEFGGRGQTLWDPNLRYRSGSSTEQLFQPSSSSPPSGPTQPPVYQGHLPGNRHSYSGGPILLPNLGVLSEEEAGLHYAASPTFHHRRLIQAQRSVDSACPSDSARRLHSRTGLLSAVSEDDMSGRKYDVVDQGPEMSDSMSSSPRGDATQHHHSAGGTPQLTPKHSARSQQQQQQQPMLQPVAGQVLVDPSTGQHFIVPSAAGQPSGVQPVFYQPLYYPAAAPAPAPHGYYPYAPMQGYAMAPLPQFSSRFAVPGYGRQTYQQAACSTDDLTRNNDDAHSTSSSSQPPGSPHFSNKGVTSFAAGYHQSRRENDQQRPSPPSSQPEDPEGTRDGFRRDVITRSSAEFRLPPSSSLLDYSSRFHPPLSSLPSSPGSAPVLQQMDPSTPLWWAARQRGGRFAPDSSSLTDVESASSRARPTNSPPASSTVSDSETPSSSSLSRGAPPPPIPSYSLQQQATTFAAQATQESQPTPKPKAIRMEIDLGKPMPEEEELKRVQEEKDRAKASRAPPTAFTVSFGNEGEGGAERKKGEMSLQDAARRGRMMRRSQAGPTRPATAQPSSGGKNAQSQERGRGTGLPRGESHDDKGFLLDRLLHGDKSRPATADAPSSSSSTAKIPKDSDNSSDAGTYVIGQSESRQHSAMITSQIIERDSDASSTATETTASRSPSPVARQPLLPPGMDSSRVLLSELAKLRAETGRDAKPPAGPSPQSSPRPSSSTPSKARQSLLTSLPNRSVFGMAASSAGLTPSSPRPSGLPPLSSSSSSTTHHHPPSTAHLSPPSTTTSSSNSTFRRADGGRFSMRSGTGQSGQGMQQQGQGGQKRPPFKVGGGRPLSGNADRQRENEMNAWLRRKDYNPMKAAMEAKKAAALQKRSDQFTNNRSISFHVGGPGAQRMPPPGSELARNKSSESLAANAEEEARSHASQRCPLNAAPEASRKVIAEYSRGVVEDINKLTKQHSSTKDEKALSGLAKVVDQLSTKCKKSIELIRAQNKGCLSVSVEDLLATAVEPPRDDECLTDQLDRLSNAFDAVQRYLEQYSLDDKGGEFSSEEEDDSGFTGSGGGGGRKGPSSTFTSLSAYRQPRNTGGSNRSTFSAVSRPARTTAYRAKLLATQHRSPSGGRPSKNN